MATPAKPTYPLNPLNPSSQTYCSTSHLTVSQLASVANSTPEAVRKLIRSGALAPAVAVGTDPQRLVLGYALQLWSRQPLTKLPAHLTTQYAWTVGDAQASAPYLSPTPTPATTSTSPLPLVPPIPGTDPDDDNARFNKARADKEEQLAIKAKIEVDAMSLSYIHVSAVESVLFRVCREARNILLGIPLKIGDTLAAEADVFVVRQTLLLAIEDALEELSDSQRMLATVKSESLEMLDGKLKKSAGVGQ